jgi:NTE family protein
MRKIALVLYGDGARGAFQVTAEKYAREVKSYKWDIISGVSIGAFNATLLSMQKYEKLMEFWQKISAMQVYRTNVAARFSGLFSRSLYNYKPLLNIIEKEMELVKIVTKLRIGSVCLRSGDYKFFTPRDQNFSQAVFASTAIPLLCEPINVSSEYHDMVSGTLRSVSPIGDILDTEPDLIVIINCSPEKLMPAQKLKNICDIAKRTVEVMVNEIMQNDIRQFLRINHNVYEAAKKGLDLHNDSGKKYKYYECRIIQPDKDIGSIMDFSKKTIDAHMEAGWRKAKEILG